ncbi:MAG: hypothetical protein WCS92_04405 [Candidatus Babeliales bacterium]|jgi:hypothetical protein
MKKLFGITFYVVLALSVNLKATMQESTASEIEIPSIEQLESQLIGIIPDERAHEVLKGYYSQVIKLQSQGLDAETLAQRISQLATNTAKEILSFGVNIEALKKLIQDPKWNTPFQEKTYAGSLLSKLQQLTQPVQSPYQRLSFDSCMRFITSILFALLMLIVIKYLIQNIPSTPAPQNTLMSLPQKLLHGWNCPCAEFHQDCVQPQSKCPSLLIRCLLHELSEFIAGTPCPYSK